MTPEEAQTVQAHVEAIAAILYANTDPANIKTLEGIELSVRQHVNTCWKQSVPRSVFFLSVQAHKQQQAESVASKAVSAPSKSLKSNPRD